MKPHHILLYALISCSFFAQAQELMKDSKTGKYGFFITNDAGDDEWVIAPQFDEGEDFFGENYTFVKKDGKWGLINTKGETVLPFEYAKPVYADYNESLRLVTKNKKHGVVSVKTGKEQISCIYNKPLVFMEEFYWNNQMMILAVKKKKAGFVDSIGRVVIDFLYDNKKSPFSVVESALTAGTIITSKKGKRGIINYKNNILVPFQYTNVGVRDYPDTLSFSIEKKGKHGIYSATLKKELVPPVYDGPVYFDEDDYTLVSRKKKYGFINKQGKEIIPCTGTMDEAYEALRKLSNEEEEE